MSDPFLGQIRLFPFDFAPTGWAVCEGQILQISQNTALFSLLGTTYGGDGKSTFALPDLRGRVPIHAGQGPGLSLYDLGESAGTEHEVLTSPQMPAHSHTLNVSELTATRNCRTGAGTAGSPAGNVPAGEAGAATTSYTAAAPDDAMHPSAVSFSGTLTAAPTGDGVPHNNLQPYLTLNYCIAMQGIFPSRG